MADLEQQSIDKLEQVGFHTHNGVDAPRIDPRDLNGFPIFSSVPAHDAPEGTLVWYRSGSTYRLYARINKGWRVVALT